MKCPYCAEDISDDALACRWCGRDFFIVKPLLRKLYDIEQEVAGLKLRLEQMTAEKPPLAYSTSNRTTQSISSGRGVIIIALFATLYVGWSFAVVESDLSETVIFVVILSLPLLFGVALGLMVNILSPFLLFPIGIGIGIAADLTRLFRLEGIEYFWTTAFIYERLAHVTGPALLLVAGSVAGRWLRRKWLDTAPTTGPSLAFARRYYSGRGLSAAEELSKSKKLAEWVAALAPILTFLASVLGAYLTYLGTIAKAGGG